ncbi:MAG: VanW family protein, partial [Acidimicrobiia bacterium]|nr:VanW family protein [Acidimicrobiia bacterium]
PGETGLRVDSDRIIEAILKAAQTPDRSGQLPVIEDAEPDVTVADLEALKIEHVVSSFTTYHDCCANRVINIHLMADTINGSIVMPGEVFSINETVGERTQEKGYLPAGTIVNGELEDTFGGGVSQFATTMYNAVFWGGYTDVTHKPHSIYFSRYPEGIEATLDYPSIDLAFRNQTDGALYIKTEYSDTSLTVKILGRNGGRTVAGERRNGSTNLTVVSEGDPSTAIRVSATVSDRYGFTSPDTVYQANPEIEPGTSDTIESGLEGWSVKVTRVLTYPDGTTTSQEWVARYRSRPVIVEVHPCDIPKGNEGYTGSPCPTTTTTTVPLATTTTTVAPTTTTAP